jgi:flagellin
MESAIRNNSSMYENLSDARSRIEDTDYAEEASKLAQLMVRQQVIASLFSRIINSKSIILSLLGN